MSTGPVNSVKHQENEKRLKHYVSIARRDLPWKTASNNYLVFKVLMYIRQNSGPRVFR